MECDGQNDVIGLREPSPRESTDVPNQILSQGDFMNDSEMCRKQLELAEEVLEEDPNYSEAKFNCVKHSGCEDRLNSERYIEKSPRNDPKFPKSPAAKSLSCDRNNYDAQVLEDGSLFVPSETPATNEDNSEATTPKRKQKFSRIYQQDSLEETLLADEDTKRPQRKQKPVNYYSQELLRQGSENNLQSTRPIPGKKKQSKPSCFAVLHGAQVFNKPCAVCFKHLKSASFLSCNKCMEFMHVSCIFSKSNSAINVKTWLCPKCKYLAKLPLLNDQPKVVVEEIVWALLDGVWLPATAVAKAEYRILPLALFVNRNLKNDTGNNTKEPFEGEKLVQWFGLGRATYSWIKEEDIQDFIQLFEIHANQQCQNVKRRKIDLDKKIKLALNAIPDFRPKGWLSDSKCVPESPAHDAIIHEEPCKVCDSLDDEDKCLICDNCNMCLHYFCIGLAAIPDGAWICPWCAQGHKLTSKEGNEILTKFKKKEFGAKENHVEQLEYISLQLEYSQVRETHSRKRTTSAVKHAALMQCQSQPTVQTSSYPPQFQTKRKGGNIDAQNTITSAACAVGSCQASSSQSIQILFERQLLDFYRKLEHEYGFRKPGFHGEQDWLEGSLIGYGRIPLPTGPEVIARDTHVIMRSGYGLLHGGTIRREVVRAARPSQQLMILQYCLRKTSITMHGPMSALHFLQTLSNHVRKEAARNYIMSEALLWAVQAPEECLATEAPHSGLSKAPWLEYHINEALIREYVVDCSPSISAMTESVPELNICPSLVDSLEPEHIENAAEAAIASGNLKFGGFKHIQGNIFETVWTPAAYP